MKVVFKKNVDMGLYKAKAGNIVKMTEKKAKEEILKGNVEQYFGEFPPRFKNKGSKTKINLKDLK